MDQAEIQRRFGARVRQLREAVGLSQEESAHQSGLDRSYVGQVERGERNISLFNIYKIANGIGVRPNDLFVDVNLSETKNVS